jgi:hypothetical protein
MIPLGFPPCSKWRIVAPLAALFSLRAIIAVTWHEWGIATASEVRIGGHQMRLVHHSQGWVSSSDYQRNGKADRYGIRGQFRTANGFFNSPRSPLPSWADWTRRPHRMSVQATSFLAGEASGDSTWHLAAIAALAARRSARGFEYASRGEDASF